MLDAGFPALYWAADAASNKAQKTFLQVQILSYVLLIGGAVCALIEPSTVLAIVSAVYFLGSLLAYAYIQQQDFQAVWYRARALAESTKTATWRLLMGAQPFGDKDEQANLEAFRRLLTELLKENVGIGRHLVGEWSSEEQVTPEMMSALRENFDHKKTRYLSDRIDHQRIWYTKKSVANGKASRSFFALTSVAYGIAIVLLLVRIGLPDVLYLPIEVFAVIASSLIGWKQIKRFDELSSAYGLTAHELGIVKTRYSAVSNELELAAFVSDAENAFSREHTQWAARRDH